MTALVRSVLGHLEGVRNSRFVYRSLAPSETTPTAGMIEVLCINDSPAFGIWRNHDADETDEPSVWPLSTTPLLFSLDSRCLPRPAFGPGKLAPQTAKQHQRRAKQG